ncbi:MAG: hypothetical protein AMXMBFR46_06840 [Acidimicrobiia bacterium]
MLARLPLRSKLILVVSVPLFVILGFAGFGMANRIADLEDQREYGRLRLPNAALGHVDEALQDEGVLTTWAVAAKADPAVAVQLDEARDTTDRAVTEVEAAGRALSPDDVSAGTRRAWRALDERLGQLGTLRRQADERAGLPVAFAERYAGLTDETIDVSARLARDVDDRQLSDALLGIVSLRREQAGHAREAMVVLPYLVSGSSTQYTDWVAAVESQDAALDAFLGSASPEARSAFLRARERLREDPFRTAAQATATAFPKAAISPTEYSRAWQDRQEVYSAAIASVQRGVDVKAAALEEDALRAVLVYGLGVSALVLTVLVLAWVMVRSVNRSLHSLTVAARDVAENQLPHLVDTLQRGGAAATGPISPLSVESRDEIGALAQAFNTIQETTVRVAEEQSALLRKGIGDLYVNLARRNQSRVDRPIGVLDVLEAHAEDPDQLASLFELDHLATRMRRNAESLLVLAGAGTARQWTESIPILDVVRAASGEIADFARVNFVGFEGEVAVAGNAVADVTHILAELLENATAFSPPGSPVVVAGMLAERRFVVSITDEGIGMDDQRLAAANALLQQPPPPGLALSRTLGLHVVAHLAIRYGIRVQLRRAASNGVTAIIALPSTVLTQAPKPEHAPAPSPAAAPTAPPAAPPETRSEAPPSPMSPAAYPVAPVAVADPVVEEPVVPAPVVTVDPGPAEPVVSMPAEEVAWSAPTGEPMRGWSEPLVVPRAFDPGVGVPPAAPPVAHPAGFPRVNGSSSSSFGEVSPPDPLPHRNPGSSALSGSDPAGLPRRSPGTHLSHRPAAASDSSADADTRTAPDPRPRPERVHDLLTRHLRGIRDGRGAESPADGTSSSVDAEERR